ncbi:hypothetical protein Trydic_g18830 [Trypoxylus dichotomus]
MMEHLCLITAKSKRACKSENSKFGGKKKRETQLLEEKRHFEENQGVQQFVGNWLEIPSPDSLAKMYRKRRNFM